jgi:hypothetical protein
MVLHTARILGQEPPVEIAFTLGIIPKLHVTSHQHFSESRHDVHFDVFFNDGPKHNVAIYTINTGRKQLVLTPELHRSLLENLIQKHFTVVVADFKDKQLLGMALEHYVVQLTEDVREVIGGRLRPSALIRPSVLPKNSARDGGTGTEANDYFTLMPGFTVQRDIAWFRHEDIPAALRDAMARQLQKSARPEDAAKVNTYDIIHPAYGPAVGVLTNYASSENERQDYYPLENMHMVMSFAFKNLSIVHQQYFNDPVGGYHKGYDYYGDQFATNFIRHLKARSERYHIDPTKIACFGHSKGSELPGMLINKRRDFPPFRAAKADFKRTGLTAQQALFPTPHPNTTTDITCAILGAGIANAELAHPKLMPWDDHPQINISPFFLYADHREDTRRNTAKTVAKAKEHGVVVETAEMAAHTWPCGPVYDQASTFVDRHLKPIY